MGEEIQRDEEDVTSDVTAATETDEVNVEVESVTATYEDVPFRVMHMESVLYDLTDPSPMVHLLEAEAPFRYLVIPVALPDAIAIQHAHSAVEGRRPTTHELFNAVLAGLGTEVIAARSCATTTASSTPSWIS